MHARDNRIEAFTESDAPAERSFADLEGTLWRVYEQAFADYDRRTGMSLIFASDAAVRRVRVYPANWMELNDQELAALSWNA